MNPTLLQAFTHESAHYMALNLPRIEKCLDLLSEEQVWQRPNQTSNSVGNLVLHLCGNITQYILSGLGQQPDHRQRDAEFSARQGHHKQALMAQLRTVVEQAMHLITQATEAQLLQHYKVQGFDMSGTGIVIHVVEHFSYHTGQIAFWTKELTSTDLGFYKGLNLNAKNEN